MQPYDGNTTATGAEGAQASQARGQAIGQAIGQVMNTTDAWYLEDLQDLQDIKRQDEVSRDSSLALLEDSWPVLSIA